MATTLIVLEGIDCSGKSTIAKLLAEKLGYRHEHEPTFSSEEADDLNFKGMDGWQREFFFMKDRMLHQDVLENHNVVLDRYIWTGLAYAQCFSPEVVPMMKSVYALNLEFKQPDLTFFIDMPPETAYELNLSREKDKNEKLNIDTLETIRQAYYDQMETMMLWGQEIVVVKPIVGDIDATLNKVLRRTNAFFQGEGLSANEKDTHLHEANDKFQEVETLREDSRSGKDR